MTVYTVEAQDRRIAAHTLEHACAFACVSQALLLTCQTKGQSALEADNRRALSRL
ncbi:MAG: hypothetical protein KatS3mg038_1533 [Candidatus Kapaibacterium sp.]|nr:MAG: hypothetical protein KatS3mg038_1533 [Candidatus Kapabacteria bacterium]